MSQIFGNIAIEMTYLFVDTNILLHYRRLEEIDWLSLSESKEAVVVLCPVVIRELDHHKTTHSQSKIRKRAQEVVASLHSKLFNETSEFIRSGVKVKFAGEEPSINFQDHQLRPEINDDWLIASVIEFKQKNQSDEVKIVSADLGISMKAKSHGIKVLRPPEVDKLPEELDSDEKRIRDLQKELTEIKSSFPELTLLFWESETPYVIQTQLQQPVPFSEEEANVKLNQVRLKNPYFTFSQKKTGTGRSMSDILRRGISQAEADRYNVELNSFYQNYVQYLHKLHEFENLMRMGTSFEIGLDNSGTVPADDVDIHLYFPDGFLLFDCDNNDNLPRKPEPPEPPDEPGTLKVPSLYSPTIDYTGALRPPSNISSPQIEKTNSYNVRLNVKKAKHGYRFRIAKFLALFDSYESAVSFKINYTISAANLPKAVNGHLSIVFDTLA